MPDNTAEQPAPAAEVEPETITPPEGFAWINRMNGRVSGFPIAISILIDVPVGVVEQLPVTEGLTVERIPPRSKYRQR